MYVCMNKLTFPYCKSIGTFYNFNFINMNEFFISLIKFAGLSMSL